MDPITALATVMQLIGLYRQEVGRRTDLTSEEFMTWLQTHRHDEIKNLISETFHLQDQVNVLLREDHTRIIEQLEELSGLTLAIARQFDCLAPLLEASPPERRLPDQALGLLIFMCQNDASGLELISMMGGKIVALIPSGITGQLSEPQFIEEDCDLLTGLGYFRSSYSSSGNPRYTLTREGSKFGKSLPIPNEEEN